jgi:chromosome segregation ATPase
MGLPAKEAGAGPLRPRAEHEELRELLSTIEVRRAAVQAAAQQVHDEVVRAETAAAHAADETAAAQQSAAQAAQVRNERDRVRERAARELADAVALREKLAGRHNELGERVTASIVAQEETAQRLADADDAANGARALLVAADRMQDEARELRAAHQVAHAQAEARRQVATERRERLDRERESAVNRLAALEKELATLAEQDGHLEEQMTVWQQEIASRRATQPGDRRRARRGGVRALPPSISPHLLDGARRADGGSAESQAELRFAELRANARREGRLGPSGVVRSTS